MALPLLQRFSEHSGLISRVLGGTQRVAAVDAAVSERVHRLIAQKSGSFALPQLFDVLSFVEPDAEITGFCLREEARELSFSYLEGYDFCEYEAVLLNYLRFDDYFRRLFTAAAGGAGSDEGAEEAENAQNAQSLQNVQIIESTENAQITEVTEVIETAEVAETAETGEKRQNEARTTETHAQPPKLPQEPQTSNISAESAKRCGICADLLSGIYNEYTNEYIENNDWLVRRVFFHFALRAGDKSGFLRLLTGGLLEELARFVAQQLEGNAPGVRLTDYLYTIETIEVARGVKSDGNSGFLSQFPRVQQIEGAQLAGFIDIISQQIGARLVADGRWIEAAAELIMPFLALAAHKIANRRLMAAFEAFLVRIARKCDVDALLQFVGKFEKMYELLHNNGIEKAFLNAIETFAQVSGPELTGNAGILRLALLVQQLVDPLRSRAQLNAVIRLGQLDMRAFDVFMRLFAMGSGRVVADEIMPIMHSIVALLVTGKHLHRETGVVCARSIVRHFGEDAARILLNLMLQQISNSYEIFYVTNAVCDLLEELITYKYQDKNGTTHKIIVRKLLGHTFLRMLLSVVQQNLFSNAQQVRHSELFNKMVGEDKVYELISLMIASLTFEAQGCALMRDVVMPLLLKSRDYKTDMQGLLGAVESGLARNTSFRLPEAVQLALYLLNDKECRYCKTRPQHHRIFIDRRQQILDNEKLTAHEKEVELENVHQLLDNALPPQIHDSYISIIKDISYDPYLCIKISLGALRNIFTGINHTTSSSATNDWLENHIRLCDGAVPPLEAENNFVQEVEQYNKELQTIFDYAVYCGGPNVLEMLYCCLNRYLAFNPHLSQKFVKEAIGQLDFIVSQELKSQIFDTVLLLTNNGSLDEMLEEKLLLAAVVHSKIFAEGISAPFKVILQFEESHYAKYEEILTSTADFFLKNGVFKLEADKSGKIADYMSKIIAYEYMCSDNSQILQDLLKIAVESELLESRAMSLKALEIICLNRRLQFIGEKGLIGLIPAREAASGVVAEELRKEIARTFTVFTEETDLSLITQFVRPGGRFFTIVASLLLEVLSLQPFSVGLMRVDTSKCKQMVREFLVEREEDIDEVLQRSKEKLKTAQCCIKLAVACDMSLDVQQWAVDEELIFDDMVAYFRAEKTLFSKEIVRSDSELTSRYVHALGHIVADPVCLIEALGDNPSALLQLLSNWVKMDEEKVLIHGKALIARTLQYEDRVTWLEQARDCVGIDEVFEYIAE